MRELMEVFDLMRWMFKLEMIDLEGTLGAVSEAITGYGTIRSWVEGHLSFGLTERAYAALTWVGAMNRRVRDDIVIDVIGKQGSFRVDTRQQRIDLYDAALTHVSFGSDPTTEMLRHFVRAIQAEATAAASPRDALVAYQLARQSFHPGEYVSKMYVALGPRYPRLQTFDFSDLLGDQ